MTGSPKSLCRLFSHASRDQDGEGWFGNRRLLRARVNTGCDWAGWCRRGLVESLGCRCLDHGEESSLFPRTRMMEEWVDWEVLENCKVRRRWIEDGKKKWGWWLWLWRSLSANRPNSPWFAVQEIKKG